MMDDLNQGLSSLVRFGVSDQLIQDLRAIEDSADMSGNALYDQTAIYEMRCALLCRNYAKALWEYSHYIALIEHEFDAGLVEFFWEQSILNAPAFKQWLEELAKQSSLIKTDKSGVKALIGKRVFSLNPRRINLMAAWTAFLVLIEPEFLGMLSTFRQVLSEKRIDDCAKQLKGSLDRYLEPHLQPIHQQRQGRILLTWLQRYTDQAPKDSLVQDEHVLAFWQHHALSEEGDFKRFVTVAECAYRLHEAIALSESQQQIEGARSYHQDQWGENATWLIDEVSQVKSNDNLFETLLDREPARAVSQLGDASLKDIKFLTAKDGAFCEKFELAGAGLSALPLTFLRAQVFGLQQARLTEDIRATKGRQVRQLIALEDISGFIDWYKSLLEQLDKISQTRTAICYILYRNRHPAALTYLLERLSHDQKKQLSALFITLQGRELEAQDIDDKRIDYKRFGNSGFEHLASIAEIEIKRLETTFNKVNRSGFKGLPEDIELEPYLAGDTHLATLESLLGQYSKQVACIAEMHGGMASLEAKDAEIFSKMFNQLYGEHGDTQ